MKLGFKHILTYFFFFLNQQFITRHMVVDYGNYFVTTYNRSSLHVEMEIEGKKRKNKWKIEN